MTLASQRAAPREGGNIATIDDGFVSPTRPSTLLRIARLRKLISELSRRQMDLVAIAAFLNCSQSAARNYLRDLAFAGVVVGPATRPGLASSVGKQYRLVVDPFVAERLPANLLACSNGDVLASELQCQGAALDRGGCQHILSDAADDVTKASGFRAQRDPLVVALFGPPNLQEQP